MAPQTTRQEIRRLEDEVRTLVGIGKTITGKLDIDAVLRAVVDRTTRLLRPRNWTLFLRHPETGDLIFTIIVGRVSKQLQGKHLPVSEGIAGWIARTGRPVLVRDVSRDRRFSSRFDELTGFRTRSILGAPLKVRGEVLGVLELVNAEQDPAFGDRELRLLEAICDFAAIALANARNHARILELTRRDHLTVLYNSRHLHHVVRAEFRSARRTGRPVSVIFYDLDSFKAVVDRHGHWTAASILTEVGALTAQTLRGRGTGFRYGGDEFTVVLPGAGPARARRVAGELRRALRIARFGGRLGVQLTTSIGVAAFPDHARTPAALIQRADKALYRAKAQGKDTIVVVPG
jgi:diguanylate cyclase (GGDEF)-like protein